METNSQLRIARYQTHRNIIAVIQWIPFITAIFGLRYLLQVQDNPEVHTLWLLLGLFFSSAFLVLNLSARWARCNVCLTRFPTFAWWYRQMTTPMFPDFCPHCKAPVMAKDGVAPPVPKSKIEWPAYTRSSGIIGRINKTWHRLLSAGLYISYILFMHYRWGLVGLGRIKLDHIAIIGVFAVGSIWFAEDLAETSPKDDGTFYLIYLKFGWLTLILCGVGLAIFTIYVPAGHRSYLYDFKYDHK